MTGPAARWVVPAAVPATGGTQELALLNPGRTSRQVTVAAVRRGRAGGRRDDRDGPRGPHRDGGDDRTFSSEALSAGLIAQGGTIVVGTVSSTPDGNGFGATTGVPWPEENGAG